MFDPTSTFLDPDLFDPKLGASRLLLDPSIFGSPVGGKEIEVLVKTLKEMSGREKNQISFPPTSVSHKSKPCFFGMARNTSNLEL